MSVLCMFNLTFFLQHMISIQFIKKLMRFYTFQTFHFTDGVLFIINIIIVNWFLTSLLWNTSVEGISQEEERMRIIANIQDNVDY